MIQPQRLSHAFLHGLLLERWPDMPPERRSEIIDCFRGWLLWNARNEA